MTLGNSFGLCRIFATEGSSQSSQLRASAVDRRRWASDAQARRRTAVQRIHEHHMHRALGWWRRWQRWAVATRAKSAKAADTIVRRILNRLTALAFTRWAVYTLEKTQLQRRARRVRCHSHTMLLSPLLSWMSTGATL